MLKRIKSISPSRYLIYLLGIIILSLGITLNTKTQLGISPVISVPYCISQIASIDLGFFVFLYYGFLMFLQFIIYKGKMEAFQILQIVMSFINSLFIDIFNLVLPVAATTLSRYLMLAVAIIITAIGASITVGMNIVPNPADGMAKATGELFHKDLGFGKNVLDFTSIVVTLVIGLVFARSIIGIGIGTVMTMIFTGRVIALCRKPVQALYNRVSGEENQMPETN